MKQDNSWLWRGRSTLCHTLKVSGPPLTGTMRLPTVDRNILNPMIKGVVRVQTRPCAYGNLCRSRLVSRIPDSPPHSASGSLQHSSCRDWWDAEFCDLP